jgi:hypothetical protein
MRASRGGPSGGSSRLALAFLAAGLAFSPSLASCGLETVRVYSAPSLSSSGGLVTLTHNAANDADAASFLGYEVYYRAYQDSAAASADISTLAAFIGADSVTPESCISKLESMKFHRFYNYLGQDARPLFNVDIATSFNIFLDQSNITGWYVDEFSKTPIDTSPICRAISSSDSAAPFNSTYESTDADYSGSTISSGTLYFAFYAIAYGVDFASSFKEIYSLPASIGTPVEFSFNQ